MIKLSLADLHCDTAFELFKTQQSIVSNSLSVSLKKSALFEQYIQIAAIWSDSRLDNNSAYRRFFEIADYFKRDTANLNKNPQFILSLEDARILNNDISRLTRIYSAGVKTVTLLWKGETCIGGSYDTDVGLSAFGKSVVQNCIELQIITDISHASISSADDIFEICCGKLPIIASHSDSYSVNQHPRNLRDTHFELIKASGGVVGINLCAEHLGATDFRTPLCAIMKHIEHYLSLGGENTLCFGCDFDGAETPRGFEDISSLPIIAEEMSRLNYSNELINKIFFSNAKNFVLKNIKL